MRNIYLSLAMVFIAGILRAGPVTWQEAQLVAISFYMHIAPDVIKDYAVEDVSTTSRDGLVTFYTFRFHSGGFVIVAADDASVPILGYSAENPFPEEILCPATREWLNNYSKQICEIIKTGLSNRETLNQWVAIRKGYFHESARDIEPLLNCSWGQGCYYNELCPLDPNGPCGHVTTGCGATAMAMIMKYHEFPPQGVGSHTYPHPVYGEQTANFENTFYEWDSMPGNVIASNIWVATLMYHAGVSVNMDYGSTVSNSCLDEIREAFVDHFNYDPGIECHIQSDYTDPEEWKDLLRADLDNQLPVFYWGYGPVEGHYFICDGYRIDNELFHFNWGWNGAYNGWYTIGALNPAGHDYNTYNSVLTHIKPYNPELITRIIQPVTNVMILPGSSVDIEAETIRGIPDLMKIIIDGSTVSSGSSVSLSYTLNTSEEDLGSHEVMVWSFSGNDSVYYPVSLNVAEWITQTSGFHVPMRSITYMSAVDSNVIWAGAWNGISEGGVPCQDFTRTLDGGTTWIAGTIPDCDGLTSAMMVGISATKAYVLMFRWSGNNPQGVYVTTDDGLNWSHQPAASFSSPYSFPDCIHFFNDSDGWCIGDPTPEAGNFEIYTTTDGGINWIPVPAMNIPSPLTGEYGLIGCCSAVNDTIWFGTTKGRVYKSVDKGDTWSVTQVPDMEEEYVTPVFRNGSHGLVHNFFGCLDQGRLSETFDGGETWSEILITGPLYRTSLAYIPGTANTWISTGGRRQQLDKGASVSYDGGHSWTDLPGTRGVKFRYMTWLNNRCGWAGSYNLNDTAGGILRFAGILALPQPVNLIGEVIDDDVNLTWETPVIHVPAYNLIGYNIFRDGMKLNNEPLTMHFYNDLNLVNGQYTYCVTAVYDEGESDPACILADITVDISEIPNFSWQMFPVPAFGIYNIQYKISDIRYVLVEVLDVNGQRIRTLMKKEQSQGEYTIRFDASGLPAAVYFVRLQAGNEVVTKKVVVMK